jgi:hypothetical protein
MSKDESPEERAARENSYAGCKRQRIFRSVSLATLNSIGTDKKIVPSCFAHQCLA